jgi:hypothetical protein
MNRVVVPARQATCIACRNWSIGIDSWAPLKFKNSGSECSSGGGPKGMPFTHKQNIIPTKLTRSV